MGSFSTSHYAVMILAPLVIIGVVAGIVWLVIKASKSSKASKQEE